MKKILTFIVFLFAFLMTTSAAFAENFYINNYNVNMKVNTDKSVNITENIDVVFTNSSHGIFRNIPLSGGEISNVSVSEKFQTSRNGTNYVIKIGNPSRLVQGNHSYTINYTHHLKDKPNEFYYNIIGTGWTVPIQHASFSVEMPKPFNAQAAGISIGKYGTVGFKDRAEYSIYGQNITGQTFEKLNPGEGITLRIPLANGYFNLPVNFMPYNVVFSMILLTLISWFIWFIVGRDEQVIPVVNFYPPGGCNSAEAEVLYAGQASEKGLVSLIIWLANKGYLEISQRGSIFTIKKVKDYDGDNDLVYDFMTYLVPNGEVSNITLETSTIFYKKCLETKEKLNKIREKIFDKASIGFGFKFIMLACLIGLVLLEIFVVDNYKLSPDHLLLMTFPVIACVMLITNFKKNPIFMTIWALLFGGVPLYFLLQLIGFVQSNVPVMVLGLVCIVISGICLYHLPKRNSVGNRSLGELLGFKKFLETVELSRVKMLVDKNPNYCFDVLPYLYIFDLSDKWINQFEQFFKEPPSWYHGKDFHRGFHTFTHTASSLTQPSVANGGISHSSSSGGGGGHSGGGCGGGGGGSW